jgi:hypothetical protein
MIDTIKTKSGKKKKGNLKYQVNNDKEIINEAITKIMLHPFNTPNLLNADIYFFS